MRFKGFIGQAYTLRSVNVEAQRCVNLYPEIDELGTMKDGEVDFLAGVPGKRLLCTVSSLSGYRCQYTATNGTLYAVADDKLFEISSAFVPTQVGTLVTSSGPIDMIDNGLFLMIVDGANLYYLSLAGISPIVPFTVSTDPNFIGSNRIAVANTAFIFAIRNLFYVSYPAASTIAPSFTIFPNSTQTTNSMQPIIGFVWQQRNLFLICQSVTEIWFDSGSNSANPFQIVQGGYMQIGGSAPFGIIKGANAFYWMGQDQNGQGIIYKNNGYAPQRISTHAIELALTSYGSLSGTTTWAYQEEGHTFIAFNVPSAPTTWVFDDITGMWHERQRLANGVFDRDKAQTASFAYNTRIVGDFSNGNLYALDSDVDDDGGDPLVAIRASPHLSDDMNRIFHHKFQLDFEPGVGSSVGQGEFPQVMMQYSDDGGQRWSSELWTSLGAQGNFKHRAIWRKLGQARTRVYRIMISDPVKRIIIGASLDLEVGTS
jgi:hypothetical protein